MTTENSKRTKFVELANKRVTAALNAIRLIGNLSSRQSYEYTPQDVNKICRALKSEVQAVEDRFTNKVQPNPGFSIE